MCPGNGLLSFKPATVEDVDGYVIPGSMQVEFQDETYFVPIPFTALVVPYSHPTYDPGGYGYTFPNNWPILFRRLLPLIQGLEPGMDWSSHSQIGVASGARLPKAVLETGLPGHPWEWVVWGRDRLREASIENSSSLGLATLILRSRQAAGSLPSDVDLLHLWNVCQRSRTPLIRFHKELLRLAA